MIFPILLFLFAFTQVFAHDSQGTQCRVMTFNIRRDGSEKDAINTWQQRLPRVQQILNQAKPDILGMQEPLENQVSDISALLSEYAKVGDSRGSCWWGLDTDEFNPIWFKKDRYTLHDSGTFLIDGNPSKLQRLLNRKKYGFLSRICTWALLQDKQTEQYVYVFNTHLDHVFDEARMFNMFNILQFLAQNRIDNWPVILMGDFNTNVEGGIQNQLAAAQFHNTKTLAKSVQGPENTYTGFGYHQECLIDHILALGTARVSNHVTVLCEQGGYPSDHRPVYADIVIANS